MNNTVDDISDADLVNRAIMNARPRKYPNRKQPRWVAVMDTFALGSTYSHQLCRKYGFDPDDMV